MKIVKKFKTALQQVLSMFVVKRSYSYNVYNINGVLLGTVRSIEEAQILADGEPFEWWEQKADKKFRR